MSQWCNECHRNIMIGRWKSCESDCPAFGLYFEDLAKKVVEDENNLKKFIATVCDKIGRYSPNNTDIFHGFNRGKEIAFDILIDTAKEFYGEELLTGAIHTLVKKRLEEFDGEVKPHRTRKTPEELREYNRIKQREWRAKHKKEKLQ